MRLGLYSRQTLQALRNEIGLAYDDLQRGILHFYTSRDAFERAGAVAELMREYGCGRVVKTPGQCAEIEPALVSARAMLAGGTYTADDESGDARLFALRLSERASSRGVTFRFGHRVHGLEAAGDRIEHILVDCPEGCRHKIEADAYVAALGCYTPLLVRPLGIRIPVYPVKGYSVTLPVGASHQAPTVSLTDDEYKLVMSRLGERMRIAGTAELDGYNTALNETRCAAIHSRFQSLFPQAADFQRPRYWAGPATHDAWQRAAHRSHAREKPLS